MAQRAQPSFNHGLHLAALHGDDDGVRRALRSGTNVNALDAAGRNAVMCAVAGEEYVSTVGILSNKPNFSIF